MKQPVSPDLWKKLVLQGLDLVTILDRKGTILFDTPAIKSYGYRWMENAGKSIYDLVHPDDAAYLRRVYREGTKNRNGTAFIEMRLRHKDGSWRYVQSMARNLLHDPAVRGILVSTRDNTERRKAEVLYRTLFEQSPDAVILFDPETARPHMFNDVLPRLLGYTRAEFSCLRIHDIAAERSAAQIEARRRVLLRPGIHMFISMLRTKRGELKHVQSIVRTVDLSDRKYFLAIFRDFTEQKAAEQKMKEYQDQLRRMANELSLTQERERKHIADELHDHLSQNLSLCRINLERLRELLDKPEEMKILKEIEQCVGSSLRYSRTLTTQLCPLVLYELGFEAAVAWLAENIGTTYGIKISVSNHVQMSRRRQELFAEPARIILFQAVRELLLNVVRHAGARRIWVTMSAAGRSMKVTIRDDGAGFDTALNHRSRRRSSYGLFSLRERLLALGGALHLESTPGKGTRVVFSVPIRSGGEET